MSILDLIFQIIHALLADKSDLIAENLALRQQLAAVLGKKKRPKLNTLDRIFWVWLSKFWEDWKSVLFIVKPYTVIKWHQKGFKLFWTRKSRKKKAGRPPISLEIRQMIRKLSEDNPKWGTPRIQAELNLLGYSVSKETVRKYKIKIRKPPSQNWKTFLKNHMNQMVGIDFFTVPDVMFRIFYCFIILDHGRRKILHFNVTQNPTAIWTSQQIVEAFPYNTAPRFILRDRDGIYGSYFSNRVRNMGITEVKIAPRAPWQNPYAERVIGSIRRECLNHMIIFNENHLRRILAEYIEYYNKSRTHLSLDGNSPEPRKPDPKENGKIIARPVLGGLHHTYRRAG